ncbi:unnamed protein product, partial [marine sediment metagenome]
FTAAGFEEGLKVFTRIKKEHTALRPMLENREELESMVNLDRIRQLTGSLYMQGLGLLTQALDISQNLGQTNISTLELETKELQEKLEGQEQGSALHSMITERLENNAKSLNLVKGRRDKTDEILMEAGMCRDSMREIRLEL